LFKGRYTSTEHALVLWQSPALSKQADVARALARAATTRSGCMDVLTRAEPSFEVVDISE
jgi:hypothetical protein